MLSLLENLFPKAKKKGQKAGKVAPGGAKDGQGTRLASDWRTVSSRLAEIGARHVLLHGDTASFTGAKAELPGAALTWVSHVLDDVKAGASYAEDVDWRAADAVVCVGAELPARYRQSLRLMAAQDATKPVFWVGNGFEYCGGTLSAPKEADEVEGLLYNHFQEFFGVKDPLQFRIEIYHGPEVKRYYRILEPNQSHVIRLSEHVKVRQYPVSLAAFVEHPILTRDRHYRLRLCGDVFWKDSFTTLHSAHEFNRSPDHKVEFRAPAWLVRDGAMAFTIPNFDRKATDAQEIEAISGSTSSKAPRQAALYIDQSEIQRGNVGADEMLGWRYRGFGGSNWFVLENAAAVAGGHQGNIAGNHHSSCAIVDRTDLQAGPEERQRFRQVDEAGFVLEPHPVPILPPENELVFGYESDAANPQQPYFRIDFCDADGKHLGRVHHTKEKPGPLFADDMLKLLDDPAASRARLALVSVDWEKAGLRYKGFKPMANLVVRNRRTLDQDFTEFQSCWRNLGAAVPGFPHWLTDQLAVVGRTNLFGRVRCDKGLRTGIMMVNGSGRLNYRVKARTDLIAINNDGARIQARLELPAFTWHMVWLDEILPGLTQHLGASGNGALLVQSGDADLNTQIITTSPAGAVALQHLWGY
ncbi:MAG: hypothetical protein HYU58_00855 [Proteobacteria bacterium]|nr:hypothetical protein [Pseudomonadota bacterium]